MPDSTEMPLFEERFGVYLQGDLEKDIEYGLCAALRVNKLNKVLCAGYANQDIIAIVPATKNRSGLAKAGLVLTGGSGLIGGLGYAVGTAAAKFIEGRSAKGSEERIDTDGAILFDAKTTEITAAETRIYWDIMGGGWMSYIYLNGNCQYNQMQGQMRITIVIDERLSKITKKNPLYDLCAAIKRPIPPITRQ